MDEGAISVESDVEYVTCPVCRTNDNMVWMDDGKPTRYVRCRTCRSVYASPRTSKAVRLKWLDTTYGYGEKAFQNSGSRQTALAEEAAIIRNHITGGRLLDIGCDLGDIFKWFDADKWQRCGVELSQSAAAYANKTYEAEVFTGTIREGAFPDAFFDVVTMLDMLYFVDDPRTDLNEVKRILKPSGILGIELSGQSYQLLRSRGVLCWLLDHRWTRLHTDSVYLYWLSLQGLENLLKDCGFEFLDIHVIGSPTSSSLIRSYIGRAYRTFIGGMTRMSPYWLTWAPKYLLIAKSIA